MLSQLCLTKDDLFDALDQDRLRLKGSDEKMMPLSVKEAVNMTMFPAKLQMWLDEEKLCMNETKKPTISVALSKTPASALVFLGVACTFVLM